MKEIKQVSIIGAGNVATHLAKNLHEAGIKINCICSRRIQNAKILGEKYGAESHSLMKNYRGWSTDDLVIIAVKDDAILKVLKSDLLKESNVVHTSGSYDSNDMKSYAKNYGAFYPFQTFRKESEVDVSEVPFFIEFSDEKIQEQIINLALKISKNVSYLNSEGRRKIHISGVFINNFIYYILDKMKLFCLEHNIESKSLVPLMQKTVHNALFNKDNMQTGPAVRGDMKTIKEHVEMLESDKAIQELYLTLSNLIFEETYDKKIEL